MARRILENCDGAKSADGRGFAKGELAFGRAVAIAPISLWSPFFAAKAVTMLKRHLRRQIPEEAGRLAELRVEFPDTSSEQPVILPVVTLRNGRLVIASEPVGAPVKPGRGRFLHSCDGLLKLI
jgi:hypothetical protein